MSEHEIKLPSNPYDHSKSHCLEIHKRMMSLVNSDDADVSLKAIKQAMSLTHDLLHLASDPRIAEMLESRENNSSPETPDEERRKLSRLKVVG